MKKNRGLVAKVWHYLVLFSIGILLFLWGFQVLFLGTYYRLVKTRVVEATAKKLFNTSIEDGTDLIEYYDSLAYANEVCIEIISNNKVMYTSVNYNKGCVTDIRGLNVIYKFNLNNSQEISTIELNNPKFNTRNIISAIKLGNNTYGFVKASLEPLGGTTSILSNQLIYVSILVLLLSLIISYYISKKISAPIKTLNETANKLANGIYDINFDANTDIKEINELSTTLNYANNELAKTDELRRELLANVSHDLKTPLTMIKAYSEMIKDLDGDDKMKRDNNLEVIIEEVDRLNLLVNDILDLSKIQAHVVNLEYTYFDLHEEIKMILNRFSIYKIKKYKFIYSNKKKIMVYADKKKIEQVIYNLINNAINYTGSDKKIYINIFDNKENIRVEIMDTGVGIEEKDLNLIWDKYYKTNKNHKRNDVGTGLGLSIVKNILISHNFNYGVISKPNEGSTFYFEINKK